MVPEAGTNDQFHPTPTIAMAIVYTAASVSLAKKMAVPAISRQLPITMTTGLRTQRTRQHTHVRILWLLESYTSMRHAEIYQTTKSDEGMRLVSPTHPVKRLMSWPVMADGANIPIRWHSMARVASANDSPVRGGGVECMRGRAYVDAWGEGVVGCICIGAYKKEPYFELFPAHHMLRCF